MQTVARLAKSAAGRSAPAVAAGAAAVAGTSGTSTAHADCRIVPTGPPNVQLPRKIKDEWELADFDKGRVLFEPAEIDDATSTLRSAYVKTPHDALDDLDTDTTEGSAADEIIELSTATLVARAEQPSWEEYDLTEVFQVANRLLKAPGVQQEMIKAALADPEVFSILNAKADLAGYLESTGFAARGLIEAEVGDSSSGTSGDGPAALAVIPKKTTNAPEAAEGGFWAPVAVGIAGEVEKLGKGLLQVSRWLKSKVGLTGQSTGQTGQKTEDGQQVDVEDEAESARKLGGRFMQLVGVAMLAIVCVVILRRPGVLGRMFRRRF